MKLSHLERLPAELFNRILDELVVVGDSTGNFRVFFQDYFHGANYRIRPIIQTAVLRLNKRIHQLVKSYLDRRNTWIVFDIDCTSRKLLWIWRIVPCFIIDEPESQALPEGILHVRIKFPTVARTPRRLTFLITMEWFQSFLECIRIVDLMISFRGPEGRNLPRLPSSGKRSSAACRISHGTSIIVHVHPNHPDVDMEAFLELFRMFHGPLHELSIIGARNTSSAREIEKSLTQPRHVPDLTLWEVYMHLLRLKTEADRHLTQHARLHGSPLYLIARRLPQFWRFKDCTPWAGSLSAAARNIPFVALLVTGVRLNEMLADACILKGTLCVDAAACRRHYTSHPFKRVLSSFRGSATAYIYIVTGLHKMLCTVARGADAPGRTMSEQISMINEGASDIEYGWRILERVNRNTTSQPSLFSRMSHEIAGVVLKPLEDDCRLRFQVIVDLLNGHREWLMKNVKAVKWKVQSGAIPSCLKDRGLLEILPNYSDMSSVEREQFLIADEFRVASDIGDFYLV